MLPTAPSCFDRGGAHPGYGAGLNWLLCLFPMAMVVGLLLIASTDPFRVGRQHHATSPYRCGVVVLCSFVFFPIPCCSEGWKENRVGARHWNLFIHRTNFVCVFGGWKGDRVRARYSPNPFLKFEEEGQTHCYLGGSSTLAHAP